MIGTRALVLVSFVVTVQLATAQDPPECIDGEVRLVPIERHGGSEDILNYPQYCSSGQWRMVCPGGRTWTRESAQVVCRHLGYRGQLEIGAWGSRRPEVDINRYFMFTQSCDDEVSRIQDCSIEELSSCGTDDLGYVTCPPALINEIRLMNGSAENEGRVEAYMNGRWGTVCNNQEGLARAVCAQAGFVAEGAQEMSFGPGFVPIHNCTIQNGNFSCTQITDASCDHTMDLGVVCRTFEELYNECLSTDAPTACIINDDTDIQQSPARGATVGLGAVIGVMAILMLIMAVGWIVTCVILKRKSTGVSTSKQKPEGITDSGTDQRQLQNPLYGDSQNSTLPGSQQPTTTATTEPRYEMANLTGDEVTYDVADVPGQVYSVVDNRQAAVTNQGDPYNVLVHDHGNQPPVNCPEEQYSRLEH